jgi:hypothetical protein
MARLLAQQPRPEAVRPTADPAVVQTAASDNVSWVRVRAQSAEELPAPRSGSAKNQGPSLAPPVPATALPATLPAAAPGACSSCALGEAPLPEQYATAGRAPRLEATAEFLAWWVKSASVPPLLTTSPPGFSGTLPGSTILIGDKDLDEQFRPGARFGLMWWLDDCGSYGFDSRYFFTGQRDRQVVDNSGFPPLNLFRPFFAINNFPPGGFPGPFREQVTGVGVNGQPVSAGAFSADNRSRFWGTETNYRDNICCTCNCCSSFRADLLAGFRYLNLDESLTLVENYVLLSPDVLGNPAGTNVVITDRFGTENDFYGGQLGTVMRYRRNRWSLDLRASVALGTTHQRLDIAGSQFRTPPGGASELFLGGLLALDTNIGSRTKDVFSVVPEVGLNIGYQMTDHLRAFVGYNFLYWSNVIRPGDQIDPFIDITHIPAFIPPSAMGQIPPAAARPAVLFKETDFWAQGINVGMEFRW